MAALKNSLRVVLTMVLWQMPAELRTNSGDEPRFCFQAMVAVDHWHDLGYFPQQGTLYNRFRQLEYLTDVSPQNLNQ